MASPTARLMVLRQQQQQVKALNELANANATTNLNSIRNPLEVELPGHMAQMVNNILTDARPTNTRKALDPKQQEFEQFCDYIGGNDIYRYNLNFDKVYKFLYYQTFREKKKAGGDRAARKRGEYFNIEDYRSVVNYYLQGEEATPKNFPHPVNPIAKATFEQYKMVIKNMHTDQVTRGVCGMTWDLIWQLPCQRLMKHVKERTPKVKKATYQEKVNGEFAPYTMVERYEDIEKALWEDSKSAVSPRSINTQLRHRACCLYLTSGILRSESLHHAELSDFLCLKPPPRDTDIHPMFLMINQIAEGKTNHGHMLYGRATRHRDVTLCAVGAIAFYLEYRFHCTKEFEEFSVDDWLTNSKWFDVKFLIDINGDYSKEMLNDGYGKHVKKVLQGLNLSCSKLLHLGRNLGARILEMLEEESEEIRRMGQWSPSMFDNHYSCKLPLGPIRKLAGFQSDSKLYFNKRTVVEPSNFLQRNTPMGKWCYDAYDGVLEKDIEGKRQTAQHVLRFLCEMNRVFLQDAAAMSVLHERGDHPMFHHIPLFQSEEWMAYCAEMKHALENEENPLDASLEKVLPGVHQRLHYQDLAIKDLHEKVDSRFDDLTTTVTEGFKRMEAISVGDKDASNWRMASVALNVAQQLLRGSSGASPMDLVQEVNEPAEVQMDFTGTHVADDPSGTSFYQPMRTVTQCSEYSDQQSTEEDIAVDPSVHSSFRISTKFNSLTAVWDTWYGIGQYTDVYGGITGRNDQFGAKWRKHLDKQQYSRVNRIVKGIHGYAAEKEIPMDEAVAELEATYETCNRNLQKFVDLLQDNGYLKKGGRRGKTAAVVNDTSDK
jgi:Centromere DNA-binding protein complex CBF3 subunit, domain 2/Transcriptional activator of glycolytic enzymes